MRTTDAAAPDDISQGPQPWRSAADAAGWRVVGVGKRHPRWLEFKIAAIMRDRDPANVESTIGATDRYQHEARAIARQLRGLEPSAATVPGIARLVQAVLADFGNGPLAAPPDGYESLAAEVLEAWQAHAGTATTVA
jgi:hypothetical protein